MPRKPKEVAGRISFNMPNWNGGVNTSDPAYQLKPNELREMQNTRIESSGNAIKRPGYTKVNTSQISDNYVTNMHQYVDSYGFKTAYGIVGTKLYSGMDGAVPVEVSDFFGTEKVLSGNKRASMLTWKDSLFVGNGNEPAFELGTFDNLKSYFYATDTTNNQIVKFDTSGNVVLKWGKYGVGNCEFASLAGVYVNNTTGLVYVIDYTSYIRLQVFNQDGEFISSAIAPVTYTLGNVVYGSMSMDSSGYIYWITAGTFVSGGINTRVDIYKADIYFGNLTTANLYSASGANLARPSVSYDQTNNKLYASVPQANTVYIRNTDLTASSSFGGGGTGDGQLNSQRDVFVDETNSKVYVADSSNNRVQYFDLSGTYVGQWASTSVERVCVNSGSSYVFTAVTPTTTPTTPTITRTSLTGTGALSITSTGTVYSIGSEKTAGTSGANCFKDIGSPKACEATSSTTYTGTATIGSGITTLVDTTRAFSSMPDWVNGTIITNTTSGLTGAGTVVSLNTIYFASLDFAVGDKYSFTLATPAGNLTGTFKYKMTYAVEDTDGTLLNESSGGIESNQITVTSKQVYLANVPVSPIADVSHRYVYRAYSADSGVTWGSYYYVGEITNNTAITYTDNLLTATTDIIPTTNTLVPAFKYLTMFKDSLYGAGDYNNPNYLYWTDAGDQDAWNLTDSAKPIGADDGTGITALNKLSNVLIIFKEHAVYGASVSVDATTGAVIVQDYVISQEFGSLSHWAVNHVTIGGVNGLIFLDPYKGLCFCNGTQAYQLSNKVDSDWATYDKILLMNATGIYYHKWKEFWFSITTTGSTNNQTWIFNIETKAIYKPQTIGLCSLVRMENSSGNEVIYGGSFDGYVYLLDTGVSDNPAGVATAIDSNITTPWHGCGYPSNTKIFDKIVVEHNFETTGTLTVQWAVDGNAFNTTDQQILTLTGTSGVKTKTIIRPVDSARGGTLMGKFISVKLSNNTATDTFDICSVQVEARLKKMFIP